MLKAGETAQRLRALAAPLRTQLLFPEFTWQFMTVTPVPGGP